MINLMYGAAALILLWWLSKLFAKSNPKLLAKWLKQGGGVAALIAAAVLGARGRIDMAIGVGTLGAWLLGWGGLRLPGLGGGRLQAPPREGAVSQVRSAMIAMELDHDTGAMRGEVLAGPYAGRPLDQLDLPVLRVIHAECRERDPDGLRLLEAYLDRRFTAWREDAQAGGDDGARAGVQQAAMTEQEAYEVLGLEPGASLDAVREAHRNLMKRFHPDQGGTTSLAARINAAKEILLNRHR